MVAPRAKSFKSAGVIFESDSKVLISMVKNLNSSSDEDSNNPCVNLIKNSLLVCNNFKSRLCTFTKRLGCLASGLAKWAARSDSGTLYVFYDGFMPDEME